MYLYSHQTILNSTGIELNEAGMGWDRGFGRVDHAAFDEPAEVLGVTGGAMCLRATALRQVGAFDPAYFAYYEDLDLSVRLWEAGYRLVYAPQAKLYHRFSASLGNESPLKTLLMLSNRWRFVLKHFSIKSVLRHRAVIVRQEGRILLETLRRGDFSQLRLRCRAYGRTLSGGISLLRYRWRRSIQRKAARSSWWRFVTPGHKEPKFFLPYLDFRLLEGETEAETDRILMGVNDTALGEGWHPLTKAQEGDAQRSIGPAFRAFGRAATCYLRVPQPGSYMLQLHVSHPFAELARPWLRVFCNEQEVGALAVETYRGEWRTVQFPVMPARETVTVRLLIENPLLREQVGAEIDLGLRVNEISILALDSVFLRDDLGRHNERYYDSIATSVAPSSLRAELSLVEGPWVTEDAVEVVLSVHNQGDTLWLTPEIAGSRGFVTVGAYLLDTAGVAVQELGPRALLCRPLFPGERDEVRLHLQLPKGTKNGRVKIDLVDEHVVWFEHMGSVPLHIELPS
jgi:hypothetical protein